MKVGILAGLLVFCWSTGIFAQTDFNNYRTLQSAGPMPEDFTLSTSSKVENDIQSKSSKLSSYQKRVFYEGVNYEIDEILHSGQVVYGDEISKYATDIVKRLLKSDKKLRDELRIYTLKSNATNAFSTDQGIIFVTTGLLSQIVSEAQLAFVLAHEIVHYTEKHVIKTFDWKSKNYRYSDRIGRLSQYSKENELEADRKAIELYHKAGYPLEDIYSTFDVLMYSYLPFDEIEFPVDYFNDGQLFIPLKYFPDKKFEIKAVEDYNDQNQSHPNIKKRKDSIELATDEYKNWGDQSFYLDEARFYNVRNIARFETVRSDILEADYGEALYSIFLLERDFPESKYLMRMKAQAWLNLLMYGKEGRKSRVIHKKSELEGSSATLHYMLSKLNTKQLTSVALRQVYNLYKANPDDAEMKAIYNRTINVLASIESFKIDGFYENTFSEAAHAFMMEKADTTVKDEKSEGNLSKYDRIKQKKGEPMANEFDSTKFYLYGMFDIVSDSSFLSMYDIDKTEFKRQKDLENKIDNMSSYERKKMRAEEEKNRMKLGIESLIIVEPKVFSSGYSGFDPVKSERIETRYSEVLEETSKSTGVETYEVDRRTLAKTGTDGFNTRSTLVSFLNQIVEDDEVDCFPVDYQLLHEIEETYGTSKVMYTVVNHTKYADINWYGVAVSAFIFPTIPFTFGIYIPYKFMNSNHTDLYVLIMDIEKGYIQTGNHYRFSESPLRLNLAAHTYDVLTNLASQPQ